MECISHGFGYQQNRSREQYPFCIPEYLLLYHCYKMLVEVKTIGFAHYLLQLQINKTQIDRQIYRELYIRLSTNRLKQKHARQLQLNQIKYQSRMLLVLIYLFVVNAQIEVYQKIIINHNPEAKCLDGSPPAMYLHQADSKNILIFMQGGGTCGGNSISEAIENCYQRSLTIYGSSTYWPQTKIGEGILSTDPSKNIFANWTKAILLYCDGAFHQGYAKEPISYKNTKLYFRGSPNTRAHFAYLHSRFNLTNANKVVLSGSSAGGIAAFSWQSHLRFYLASNSISMILDSSVILLYDESQLSTITQISNSYDQFSSIGCKEKYARQQRWRCFTFEGVLPFAQARSLFIQSSYDSFIISNRLYLDCLQEGYYGYSLNECSSSQMRAIQEYRLKYLNFIGKLISYNHLIWTIDCSFHAILTFDEYYQSPNFKVPMTSGRTIQEAIYYWLFQQTEIIEIDYVGWPHNNPCSF